MKQIFSIVIKLVFLLAFAAFLSASINHIASFFHQFEPSDSGMAGSYALAFAIDGTSLMLTIGMMFFAEEMPVYAKVFVWIFILLLTGFSWLVNWEYAVVNQSSSWTNNLNPEWQMINPILASSFAFLNLAYSVVSEFFGAKQKTMEQLRTELAALQGRSDLEKQIREAKGPSIIEKAKEKALEVKLAASEVLQGEEKPQVQGSPMPQPAMNLNNANPVQVHESADTPVHELEPDPVTEPSLLFDDEPVTEPIANEPGSLSKLSRRITVKLNNLYHEPELTFDDEPVVKQERNTDKLVKVQKKVAQKVQQKENNAETEPIKIIRRMLRNNPDIEPIFLAKKAGVSSQYAGRIKAKILKEKVSA